MEGGEGYLFGGVKSLIMGLVTVVRLTMNMLRKLSEAVKEETVMVSRHEYMLMEKRLAELEEKCRSLAFSPEKEENLTAALNRVDELELQLSEMKKTLYETMARQQEMVACIEKMKKKKKKFWGF